MPRVDTTCLEWSRQRQKVSAPAQNCISLSRSSFSVSLRVSCLVSSLFGLKGHHCHAHRHRVRTCPTVFPSSRACRAETAKAVLNQRNPKSAWSFRPRCHLHPRSKPQKRQKMRAELPSVLVVGGGRVGTYVACKFKGAGTTGEVVLKGSPADRGVSKMQPFVDAMCRDAGVTFVRGYERFANRVFDFTFVSVKTYDLANVRAELDAHNITSGITILVHNGIVAPLFENSVRVVIPQSYDFVEEDDPRDATKKVTKIHVKNEEKPWVMPDTGDARKVEILLEASGIKGKADPTFPYGLIRKFFINGVANLLSIVGDCDCDGLLAKHRGRMEVLYSEFIEVLKHPHADAFALVPDDFHAVVFDGLASYGQHFPSTKMDFDAGRALETDSLNGYVVGQAKRQGMAAMENEKLVNEVLNLVAERDARKK